MARTAANRVSAASPGGPRWRRPCSTGGRLMGSAPATLCSPGNRDRPVAADTTSLRADERPGVGVHGDVRPGQQHAVPSPDRPRLISPAYTEDFNAVKALGRKTGSTRTTEQTALAISGRQRQRPLESGGEPDGARQPPDDLRQQPASRGLEHRDGRYGVHHVERQAILWRPIRAT